MPKILIFIYMGLNSTWEKITVCVWFYTRADIKEIFRSVGFVQSNFI